MALTDKLSAIGDAIRAKTGGSEKLTLDSMVTEINSIASGGGGGGGADVEAKYQRLIRTILEGDATLDRTIELPCVEKVRTYGFKNSTFVKSFKLPNCKTLYSEAFGQCTQATEFYLPNAEQVNGNCFSYCVNLESISLPKWRGRLNDYQSGVFAGCRKLKNIDIPKCEAILDGDFDNCAAIEKLRLPSVTKIANTGYNSTFRNVEKLTALILGGNTVAQLTGPNFAERCPLQIGGHNGLEGYVYVPKALIAEYRTATNWVAFAGKFRAIEDYPDICGGA